MKIGMTGSKTGMNDLQKKLFAEFVTLNSVVELHHGDCVGADADAHNIAVACGVKIVIHPPVDSKLRAFCSEAIELPVKPYLARNKDIVNAGELLVAFPNSRTETLRSGTWSTVRYARKIGKQVVIFYPDGGGA